MSIVRPRRAEPQKVVVTRDEVSAPGSSDKMVENGIGYVKAGYLTQGKAQEVGVEDKRSGEGGSEKAHP